MSIKFNSTGQPTKHKFFDEKPGLIAGLFVIPIVMLQ